MDVKGGKASLASLPIEVPDFSKIETAPDGTSVKVATVGSLIVVRGIEELPPPTRSTPSRRSSSARSGSSRSSGEPCTRPTRSSSSTRSTT